MQIILKYFNSSAHSTRLWNMHQHDKNICKKPWWHWNDIIQETSGEKKIISKHRMRNYSKHRPYGYALHKWCQVLDAITHYSNQENVNQVSPSNCPLKRPCDSHLQWAASGGWVFWTSSLDQSQQWNFHGFHCMLFLSVHLFGEIALVTTFQ